MKKGSFRSTKPVVIPAQKQLSTHIHAAGTIRGRTGVAASAKKKPSVYRIARLPIYAGDTETIRARGFLGLPRVGSVTLFRWQDNIIAAGYMSAARPRHFVRVESGDFPKRLLRGYEKLRSSTTPQTAISLVEIRALHVHLIWAHFSRLDSSDLVICLLPNALELKPGKQYHRSAIERRIAAILQTVPPTARKP